MKSKKELLHILLEIIFLSQLILVKGLGTKYVTCGSVIKLLNPNYGVRLHSHDVKYGSGSGQQSVTAVEIKEDVGSHWVVKTDVKKPCKRGELIKCGDNIRLEHMTTKKNLHSHVFTSPLSGEQEISCYGNDGIGDTGDNWELVCSTENWTRDGTVKLRHLDTGVYLGLSGRSFGRPIMGQMEVVGLNSASSATIWTTAEGLYIVPKDIPKVDYHTEL